MLKSTLYAALLLAVGCAGISYRSSDNHPRTVRTREGRVRGYTERSSAGNVYVAFKGIPYAQPPVGELRFQPSRRHSGWQNTLNAKNHGSVCPQLDGSFGREGVIIGDEDCLFANVYTRKMNGWGVGTGRLPVMVFIHGGAYFRGSGDDRSYGPKYLMDEDIVLVTFNYRLGVLGFLTTYDDTAPGNYGLRDQVLLLQWVQDNIANFGGDPNAVTIFGQSAGAACVSLLVLSPLTKGLFHHAISESGSSVSNFGASDRKRGFTGDLAYEVGCPSDNSRRMVACLKKVSAQNLLAKATPDKHLYQPRIDREAWKPLLPEDPRILLESGNFHLVPWMQGVTEEEGWFFVPLIQQNQRLSAGIAAGDISAWGRVADIMPSLGSDPLDCGADPETEVRRVKDYYLGFRGIRYNNNRLSSVAKLISDRYFNAPMSVESTLAARYAPVYRYVFEYKGPNRLFWGDISRLNEYNTNPGHGDELRYLFSQGDKTLEMPGTPNHNMIRNMVSLWTSFARTGRPSAASSAAPDWPIFTEKSGRHMRLDSTLTLGEWLFEEQNHFWQTININEPWRHPMNPPCSHQRVATYGDRCSGHYNATGYCLDISPYV